VGDTGGAVCDCHDTAQGARCESCAPGYRPINGVCKLPALAIDARGDHTCAWFENGTMRCWGLGYKGELGYGAVDRVGCDGAPPYLLGSVAATGHVSHVAMGETSSCAVLDDGQAYCWGANDQGQLGYGNTVELGRASGVLSGGPIQLGDSVTRVHTSATHSCALLAGGATRCWGNGSLLGLAINQPDIGDNELPTAIGPLDAGGSIVELALATSHTCALLASGEVRCWGFNIYGELGYGFSYDHASLDYVRARAIELSGTAIHIAAGHYHSCALLSGGGVRCWGDNSLGQLALNGVANVGDRDKPMDHPPIDLGGAAVQIEAGANHTCARLGTGGVRCWGDHGSGQLGYDQATYLATQTPAQRGDVNLAEPAIDIALGESHTCALLASGAVRCWGRHDYTCALGFESNDYVISDPTRGADVELFR
jgi:alpha-tubulin suppressor-like RCC1 family protein